MEAKPLIFVYLSVTVIQLKAAIITKGYNTQVTQNCSDDVNSTMLNWRQILEKHQRVVEPTVAAAVAGSAKDIAEVLKDIREVILKDLEDELKSIKMNIEGITQEQKENMKYALTEVYKAEVSIEETKVQLGQLAKENIRAVDRMVRYLDLVKEDWDSKKIKKFLHFQAQEMSKMVDRSLDLLEKAQNLYKDKV